MAEWDVQDGKGNILAMTDENVLRLHPSIIEYLLMEYDQTSYLEDQDRKRLALGVDSYVKSSKKGTSTHSPPREMIEAGLYEMFHWTPEVVDKIPYKRLQRLFVVLNQKDASNEAANEFERFKNIKR